MNIITSLAPIAASAATLAASPTLILALGFLHLGAKVVGRLIPDSRKGILGGIRKAAKVLAAEPANRVGEGSSLSGALFSLIPDTQGAPVHVDATGFIKGIALPTAVQDLSHPGDKAVAERVAEVVADTAVTTIAQAATGKITSFFGKLKN